MNWWWLLLAFSAADDGAPAGQGSVLAPEDSALATQADPTGLNPFHPNSRSPTGRLYPLTRQPYQSTGEDSSPWQWRYGVTLGAVLARGDDRIGRYQEYSDTDDGLTLQRFVLDGRRRDSLHYLRASGGSLGRDDAYVRVEFGHVGRYKLGLWHSNIPHVFASNASVLWDGVGSEVLRLPQGLDSQSGPAAVREALAARGDTQLALEREQWGLGFDVKPSRSLRLFANAQVEQKNGTRPFGGTMAFPGNGQFTELVEPLDHNTTNLATGLQWTGRAQQLNFRYAASYFRNDQRSLTWENPALSPFPFFAPPRGQMALAPDNDYRTVKLDYARSLTLWRSRLTFSFADAEFEQNDALLPPTISAGIVNDGDVVDLDDWNTLGSLSRQRAGARRGQQLARLKWSARPSRKTRLVAHWRDERRDNDSHYTAFNPLTGQFGVVVLDGGLLSIPGQGGIYQPQVPGSRVRIASMPFSRDVNDAGLSLDYRINSKATVGLAWRQLQTEHQVRERRQVDDDEWRVHFVWRGQGTLRGALQTTSRHGDDYQLNPYEPFFSSSLPGFTGEFADGFSPINLSALRKYDLASFDRDRFELKWHWPAGASGDLNLSGHWQDTSYGADYGLKDSDEQAFNADYSLRLGRDQSVFAYLSELRNDRSTAGIRANGNNTAGAGADPNPGGVNFPLDNAWAQRITDRHRVIGGGWRRQFERLEIAVDYTFTRSRSRAGYTFASPSALVRRVDNSAVGGGFPELSLKNRRLEASLKWQVRNGVALRLLLRHETERLDDYHYLNLLDPVVEDFGATDLYLAAGPQHYDASLVAFLVELGPRQ